MTRHLNKDTTLCMSLAARPSNFGTRFHNFLYDALDLDYLYKAFTTTDLAGQSAGYARWAYGDVPSLCRSRSR
ncbi:Shikimate 5-dehydrogenase-like protein HI_0607 [Tatumella ptyseos]|uniref:Shikimate 5-dehydrogenase-like protein HI_0607 n=1 Tax=Tatumella ptyseos TaxID=82987 RepID=A0A2X5SGP0_9GAMM|nr:Shikimate 5-dehydrogenase-like protein HI_0607 [Tatumella ptyseos]